jgi:hypothetical protein
MLLPDAGSSEPHLAEKNVQSQVDAALHVTAPASKPIGQSRRVLVSRFVTSEGFAEQRRKKAESLAAVAEEKELKKQLKVEKRRAAEEEKEQKRQAKKYQGKKKLAQEGGGGVQNKKRKVDGAQKPSGVKFPPVRYSIAPSRLEYVR